MPQSKKEETAQETTANRYGIVNGLVEKDTILNMFQEMIHQDTTLSSIFQSIVQHVNSKQDISSLFLDPEQKKHIDTFIQTLVSKISIHAQYPTHPNNEKFHPALLSDLALQHYQESESYRAVKDDFSLIKRDENIQQQLSYLEKIQDYSFDDNIGLYVILSLLQKDTPYVQHTLLALLDLNIKNQLRMHYLNTSADYKEYIVDPLIDKITKINENHYIPSPKHSKHISTVLSFLSNTMNSCRRSRDFSPEDRFQIDTFFQTSMLPRYIYQSNHGLCYLLSSIHLYLLDQHGREKGQEEFLKILNNMTKVLQGKESTAVQYLTTMLCFN
ncbi:MAG: hypothetical protein K2M30_04860, partial [Desulfovibrionaceae bacterium]|nr:hypothetical protein [Desulfovibrionaceae bacterium]